MGMKRMRNETFATKSYPQKEYLQGCELWKSREIKM